MRLALIALEHPSGDFAQLPDLQKEIWSMGQDRMLRALLPPLLAGLRERGNETSLICRRDSAWANLPKETEVIKVAGSPLDLWRIWRWQKRQQGLAVLAFGRNSLAFGEKLAKMQKGKAFSLNAAFLLLPPAPWKGMARSLAKTNACICGSAHIANSLRQALPRAGRPLFYEIFPGINVDSWPRARPEYGSRFIFGMAGSLAPASGALMAVRAMSALWQQKNLPPWEMRMFGSGERLEEILAEATALGVISRLSLLSEQPLDQQTPLCHAWIAPGSAPCELPEVLDAGFASGLPVICSQSPLHEERLVDAHPTTALWVDCNNPQELAGAMIAVMKDDGLREQMAQNAWSFRAGVSMENTAAKICALLPEMFA